MLQYLFSDSLLSTCPKKWKLKNGLKVPTLPYQRGSIFTENRNRLYPENEENIMKKIVDFMY